MGTPRWEGFIFFYLKRQIANGHWTLSSTKTDILHLPVTQILYPLHLPSISGWLHFTAWEVVGGRSLKRGTHIIFLPLNVSPSIPGTILPSRCLQQKKGPPCVSGHWLTDGLRTSLPTSWNCSPSSPQLHRFYYIQMFFSTSIKKQQQQNSQSPFLTAQSPPEPIIFLLLENFSKVWSVFAVFSP